MNITYLRKSVLSLATALSFCLAARGTIDLHPADGLDGWLDAGFGQYNPVPLGGATNSPSATVSSLARMPPQKTVFSPATTTSIRLADWTCLNMACPFAW